MQLSVFKVLSEAEYRNVIWCTVQQFINSWLCCYL